VFKNPERTAEECFKYFLESKKLRKIASQFSALQSGKKLHLLLRERKKNFEEKKMY
jgi:hypothetical protein